MPKGPKVVDSYPTGSEGGQNGTRNGPESGPKGGPKRVPFQTQFWAQKWHRNGRPWGRGDLGPWRWGTLAAVLLITAAAGAGHRGPEQNHHSVWDVLHFAGPGDGCFLLHLVMVLLDGIQGAKPGPVSGPVLVPKMTQKGSRKWPKTGPHSGVVEFKSGRFGPKRPKVAKRAKTGQTGPNGPGRPR